VIDHDLAHQLLRVGAHRVMDGGRPVRLMFPLKEVRATPASTSTTRMPAHFSRN
jgi:hypothetical protein